MSATANPYFDVQHQALTSLKRVHQICLWLELAQVCASALVLTLGYLAPPLHLYGAFLYFFVAVFAHVVVYYVLLAIGNNMRDAYRANPGSVQQWLVVATARLRWQVAPFLLGHIIFLLTMMGLAIARGLSARQPLLHMISAWLALGTGLSCWVRVYFALRTNSQYLTSFVTTSGHRPPPMGAFDG